MRWNNAEENKKKGKLKYILQLYRLYVQQK